MRRSLRRRTVSPMEVRELRLMSNPPLFGRHAKRAMEAWHTQAPLLHGPRATTATDEQSSDSIPRDLVESEVRRQIQEALRAQQQGS